MLLLTCAVTCFSSSHRDRNGTDLRSEPLFASGKSRTLSISQANSSPLSWLQLHCQPSRTVSTELHLRKGFAADCLPLLVHQSSWFLGKWHTMLGIPFLIYRESGQIPHGSNQRHLAKDVLPRGTPHSLLVLTEPTPVTSGCFSQKLLVPAVGTAPFLPELQLSCCSPLSKVKVCLCFLMGSCHVWVGTMRHCLP